MKNVWFTYFLIIKKITNDDVAKNKAHFLFKENILKMK